MLLSLVMLVALCMGYFHGVNDIIMLLEVIMIQENIIGVGNEHCYFQTIRYFRTELRYFSAEDSGNSTNCKQT